MSENNFLSAGRFTVERRKAYRKEGDRWVETETELLVIRRFFGNSYMQLKVPLNEVPTLVWLLEKMSNGKENLPAGGNSSGSKRGDGK